MTEEEEWSLFMGRPVNPLEIVTLKRELAAKLEREAYSNRQPGGASDKQTSSRVYRIAFSNAAIPNPSTNNKNRTTP